MFRTSTGKYVARGGVALALTLGVMATGVSVAGASDHHHSSWSHDSGASTGVAGTVTAASTTSITVLGRSGTSTTFSIDATTTVTEGSTAAAAALMVGERVLVIPSTTTTGLAASIKIRLSRVNGKVSAISGNTITVAVRDGLTVTVDVSSATKYSMGGASSTLASVTVGSKICASGVVNTTANALDALTVKIASNVKQAWVFGKVSAVSGNNITVTMFFGLGVTVTVSSTTTYTKAGATATLADVTVGSFVLASGTVDTTANALDATSVRIGSGDFHGESSMSTGAHLFGTHQGSDRGGRHGGHRFGGGDH